MGQTLGLSRLSPLPRSQSARRALKMACAVRDTLILSVQLCSRLTFFGRCLPVSCGIQLRGTLPSPSHSPDFPCGLCPSDPLPRSRFWTASLRWEPRDLRYLRERKRDKKVRAGGWEGARWPGVDPSATSLQEVGRKQGPATATMRSIILRGPGGPATAGWVTKGLNCGQTPKAGGCGRRGLEL